MTGFESVVGVNPWTALFTFCNMIITFLVLKKFLFKPVKRMIDDRQKEIDTMYEDAGKARQEALDTEARYTEKMRQAQAEAESILSQATLRAREKSSGILQEAKQEAAAIKERAARDIALEKKRALNEAKDEISDMAMEIASLVVEKELSADDQQALVDSFLDKLGDPV